MSEEKVEKAYRQYKQALWVVAGVVLALFVTMASGDYSRKYITPPFGYMSLWIITTVGSIPIGVRMIASRWWQPIPLRERRNTAMGYLVVGLVNLIGLGIFLQRASSGGCFLILTMCYGIVLIYVFARIFELENKVRDKDELFP